MPYAYSQPPGSRKRQATPPGSRIGETKFSAIDPSVFVDAMNQDEVRQHNWESGGLRAPGERRRKGFKAKKAGFRKGKGVAPTLGRRRLGLSGIVRPPKHFQSIRFRSLNMGGPDSPDYKKFRASDDPTTPTIYTKEGTFPLDPFRYRNPGRVFKGKNLRSRAPRINRMDVLNIFK